MAQARSSHPWASQEARRVVVSPRDRVLLNQALVNDKERDPVTVLVACAAGVMENVAQRGTGLGATIVWKVAELDYLRIKAPLDRFQEILSLGGVVDATVDIGFGYEDVLDTDVHEVAWNWDPRRGIPNTYSTLPVLPSAELKPENPYVPTGDIGA